MVTMVLLLGSVVARACRGLLGRATTTPIKSLDNPFVFILIVDLACNYQCQGVRNVTLFLLLPPHLLVVNLADWFKMGVHGPLDCWEGPVIGTVKARQ